MPPARKLAVWTSLALASCQPFGADATDASAGDAAAPEAGAAEGGAVDCSGSIYCETFDSRTTVEEVRAAGNGQLNATGAAHELVGALGAAERRWRVRGAAFEESDRLDGQIFFRFDEPPPTIGYEITITFEELSNVDIMALGYERPGGETHYVYATVNDGELSLYEFEPGVVDRGVVLGRVARGETHRLELVSTSTRATLSVDGGQEAALTTSVPDATAFTVQYGPFSLRERARSVLAYDDVRVRAR